ncbi:hypothetical protein MKX01_034779 [Papaver californicum]|nr:hypothetical protein MKX01_034779 [Papaver californicum]
MSESSTTTTVVEANDTDRNTHDNDRLMLIVAAPNDTDGNADKNDGIMMVHTPKRRRTSGKEKWTKFQQSQPQREFRPRVLHGHSSKNK